MRLDLDLQALLTAHAAWLRDPATGARASLAGAYLRRASLKGAILTGAYLRGADLTGADLTGVVGLPDAPMVPDLDQRMAEACAPDGALDMSDWHTCETTHCRAGWAIHLAGAAGAALEAKVGPAVAGALIYWASTGRIPDFFADTDNAAADIAARAAGVL